MHGSMYGLCMDLYGICGFLKFRGCVGGEQVYLSHHDSLEGAEIEVGEQIGEV